MTEERFPRSSGILLHPTSLPTRFGMGDFGPSAYKFADFLRDGGQSIWQMLPLGPTGYGDSPYQCFSAFAGNPLLISLEELQREGLLSEEELVNIPELPEQRVDYQRVGEYKLPLLKKVHRNFSNRASAKRSEFNQFKKERAHWLDDYALFMALKEAHNGVAWVHWAKELVRREAAALQKAREQLSEEIESHKFTQFLFFQQWKRLKEYCAGHHIRMMGDLPIYVAHDSADVWSHPEFFLLDENGNPEKVAGVPPDYFSATGQLWGNPIYCWEKMRQTGFDWWVERFRASFELFNMVRIDHFRGFEAYWEVPAGESTAIHGRWTRAPGAEVFATVHSKLGDLPIIAENLGVITPEVEAIRHRFGFPGMAILQFAFGTDPQAPSFKPHNYTRDLVAYTGTHDNDTTVGWWTSSGAGDSTRTAKDISQEREYTRKYLNTSGAEINWEFIRALMVSVANTVIVPLQDVLGLGSEARMNTPAKMGGNWGWRFRLEMLDPGLSRRLKELTTLYERLPQA
ncbi:MAG TPA: 4-alpha-glucanotransferase [Terriglobales bacterium]